MGAGIFGLSIAFICMKRGARVQVIDPNGVGAGSSGGIVGALAPHTPENWNAKKQFQLESLLMAEAFWADVESVSGLSPGYGRHGRVQAIDTERALELAGARTDGAQKLWQGKAHWTVQKPVGDWAPYSAMKQVIFDTLSARIHPRQACESLAQALRRGGVTVKSVGDPQGRVIWATGYQGLLDLSATYEKPVGNGVKGQALALKYTAPKDAPQLFASGIHVIPHDNGTVAIGSTSERDFADATTTDAQLDDLHQRALAICPVLEGAPIVQRWAGVRPRAKSRAPMLGAWPDRKGHFIANGGFKIGFGMAPKVAVTMADLVLDQRDTIPEGFRVSDNF